MVIRSPPFMLTELVSRRAYTHTISRVKPRIKKAAAVKIADRSRFYKPLNSYIHEVPLMRILIRYLRHFLQHRLDLALYGT